MSRIGIWLATLPLLGVIGVGQVQAQSITPAADGTNTVVTPDGKQFNITGGQTSQDGANLFHSLTKFGLSQDQIANFISKPEILNILTRINGGDPSVINGLIQVTGGKSNLFLMNPAGIIFGPNASLNLPAALTVTTANGIGFGSNWFSATGNSNYAQLVGNPSAFAFTTEKPGAIINAGDLSVGEGQNLTLLGGTVASTGKLSASGGQITVAAVPGKSVVRISQTGNLLSLDVQPIAANGSQPNNWMLPVLSLPQLLTGGGGGNAIGIAVNSNGTVALTGSGLVVENGDVVAKEVSAQTATLAANHNLTLVESQLSTTGDLNLLAKDIVRVRDSVANPFIAQAGKDLYIQGSQGIDILALNHPQTPFQSGGNLSLVSDRNISGDAHFAAGGSFSMLNLSGQPGNFVSLYDPIISSEGDVTFASYTGVALKVEAKGSITGGDISITGPDTSGSIPSSDPDFNILTTQPALILQAGKATLDNPSNVPHFNIGSSNTNFSSPENSLLQGKITVGDIKTPGNINTLYSSLAQGSVILSATGDVTVGNINYTSERSITSSSDKPVSLYSISGNIKTGHIVSGAPVTLTATKGNIEVKSIVSGSLGNNGNIEIVASGLFRATDIQNHQGVGQFSILAFTYPKGLDINTISKENAGTITVQLGDRKLVEGSFRQGSNEDGGRINIQILKDQAFSVNKQPFPENNSGTAYDIALITGFNARIIGSIKDIPFSPEPPAVIVNPPVEMGTSTGSTSTGSSGTSTTATTSGTISTATSTSPRTTTGTETGSTSTGSSGRNNGTNSTGSGEQGDRNNVELSQQKTQTAMIRQPESLTFGILSLDESLVARLKYSSHATKLTLSNDGKGELTGSNLNARDKEDETSLNQVFNFDGNLLDSNVVFKNK
ncbi:MULTISPECIES: filamentous hemagglutinin N-terminal domain-containing protein [unclassified Nostoc]|uniref:filamentous hemagglutinin N-terminal domain-containing protein n=1 Tax=unclassified Nostoc TaxID=2593658 RepID=UPI001C897F9D|nr:MULTISPECIES: filamentous hemagglutinin N-terminal domain-containing protein [unclassified Nostoc]